MCATEITLAQIKMQRIDHILPRLLSGSIWWILVGVQLWTGGGFAKPLNLVILLLFSIPGGETMHEVAKGAI